MKIQNLEPVKNVVQPSKQEATDREEQENLSETIDLSAPEIPQEPVSNETQLQNLLQDLKARNIFDTDIAKEVGDLLLQIKSSVELSHEETFTLCKGLRNLSPQWIIQNAKNLSPQIIRFIVKQSFLGEGYVTAPLFESLITEPVNKENLAAWVHAFPAFKPEFLPEGSFFERLENKTFLESQLGNQRVEWERTAENLAKNKKLTGKILEENLSPEDVKIFLHHFFGFTAFKNYTPDTSREFNLGLDLVDQLNEQNSQFLLHILCYARHPQALVQVFQKVNSATRSCVEF
ncbi:MAG: hypothetical protein HWD61_15675 [Parachlamydiaceae bacterium]|nr:MAG: hypothetical protein HWD61_15675 [Parachlamydiaceae bacterium]